MITSNDIYWIAALLEGEGHFRMGSTSPQINIQMTDLDIIERFREITKTKGTKITVIPRDGYKTAYNTNIYGDPAIQWMMTIYSIMSIRRKERIKDIIEKWKTPGYLKQMSKQHNHRRAEHKLIKSVMDLKNLTEEQAISFLSDMRSRGKDALSH